MKVIHCLSYFLPNKCAGTEVYTWALCKNLQAEGVEAEVIIPNYGKTDSSTYFYDGIKVFQFAEPTIQDRAVIMGRKIPEGLILFKEYLAQEKPNVVHFHELAAGSGMGLYHILAAKELGIKVIMTFHLANYTCKTGTLVYMGEKLCDGKIEIKKCSRCYLDYRGKNALNSVLSPVSSVLYNLKINSTLWNNKLGTALGTPFIIKKVKTDFNHLIDLCDKVVVLTDWYKKILLLNNISEKKISIIKQGLPAIGIENFTANNNQNFKQLKLIFVGRISEFKGVHLILDAIELINSDRVKLDIYGSDPNDDYSIRNINRMEEIKGVEWKGSIPTEDVVSKMREYDALLLASTFSEMSPLVIQEAFAAKIPVIASNVYGNAEQISNEINGWLFNFNDAVDLKVKLQMLLDNPDLIEKAKESIPVVKSFNEVAIEYKKLYEEILSVNNK